MLQLYQVLFNISGVSLLFNSYAFVMFFIIVYSLYLRLKHKSQNRFLLIASYIFYGFWDWRFLGLILISTVVDYYCGIQINKSLEKNTRKYFLLLSILLNLGILSIFKYTGFFVESANYILSLFHLDPLGFRLNVILPIGISFYTFQTMSYTIDIYRRKILPTSNLFDFALFVAFFPQLIAGPIERAGGLLPQINKKRTVNLNSFFQGSYLVFWGLFLKVCLADNLAIFVDQIFRSSDSFNGLIVLLAIYAFAFQIFCDFAGYSTIARGLAKTMGFELSVNFNLPYFAENPPDFWRRWHITLSTWVRDYIFYPLVENRRMNIYLATMITMGLMGLWHGAQWKFVFWGFYHGLLIVAYQYWSGFCQKRNISFPIPKKIKKPFNILTMFHFAAFGGLIFRAESIAQVWSMFKSIFTFNLPESVFLPISIYMLFTILIINTNQLFLELKIDKTHSSSYTKY